MQATIPSIDDIADAGLGIGQIEDWQQFATYMPSDFFRAGNVLDPEDNTTLGPLDEQYAIMDAFAERDNNGDFIYADWVYSQCKKHGKTTLVAGILLWQAWRISRGYVPIVANDQRQADSRLFRVILYTVQNHPIMKQFAKVKRYHIELANGTTIEALAQDPEGEAGVNPTAIGWTEAWGLKHKKAILMFGEMALSPTRAGQAFRIVESYAGHSGESVPLENLHGAVVNPDCLVDADLELYANPKAGIIAYWGTKRLQPWQQGAIGARYYANQEATLTPKEFRRLHHNEWVTSEDVFCQPEWWQACLVSANELTHGHNGVVLAIDAGVSNDCFAIVGVARQDDIVDVVYTKVWQAPVGGKISFTDIEKELVAYLKAHHVVCLTYDPYQMEHMAERIKSLGMVWVNDFKQGAPRLESDKALYDRILTRKLRHAGNAVLTEHVLNANAKVDDGENKMRIVKRSDTKKIDACVALSMACYVASSLNIG